MDNNFENNIKTRLDQRRISPSNNSWDKLKTLINDGNIKDKPTKIVWLNYKKVAVVVSAILIAISILYFYLEPQSTVNNLDLSNSTLIKEPDKKNTKDQERKEIVDKDQHNIILTPKSNNTSENISHPPRESVAVLELEQRETKIAIEIPSFDPKIDVQSIINEEINRLLVNSVNPKINSALISEIQKLDLAQLIEEMNQGDKEIESRFRKNVVNKINSIYAQLSEKIYIKE